MAKDPYYKRKKKKINWGMWVTIVLVILMVSSTLGFIMIDSAGSTLRYGSHKFVQTNQGYRVNIDGTNMVFQYFPENIEHIEIPQEVFSTLVNARVLSVTYDPNDEEKESMALIQYNLARILPEQKNIYVIPGLINNTGYGLPQISCANATVTNPVIYLRSGENTSYVKENNCITIEAVNSIDFAQIHDRLLFGILGVME